MLPLQKESPIIKKTTVVQFEIVHVLTLEEILSNSIVELIVIQTHVIVAATLNNSVLNLATLTPIHPVFA